MLRLLALTFCLSLPGCAAYEMLEDEPARTVLITDSATLQSMRDAPLERTVFIGSWNMHYLGPADVGATEPRSPAAFAEYILDTGVSVLALQEIGLTNGLGGLRNAFLDEMFGIMNERESHDWRYELSESKLGEEALIGIAWNESAVKLAAEHRQLSIEPGQVSTFGLVICEQMPLAMKLSAGEGLTDFVVIVVHLRADIDGLLAAPHRAVEAAEIVRCLESIRADFDDEDVVIIGDFNAMVANEEAMAVFHDAGFRDLNQRDLATFTLGAPFDRILVPKMQPEFPGGFFVAGKGGYTSATFEEHFSDHYLVLSTIRVQPDDD